MTRRTGVTVSDFTRAKACHAAALEAGDPCNGPPGLRAHGHPNYHGAFLHCPDGRDIDAVCHEPEDAR